MNRYQPISCTYYDRLEHWATKKERLKIIYKNEAGQPELREAIIADLRIAKGIEYAIFTEGPPLRLDHIISINDIALADASC